MESFLSRFKNVLVLIVVLVVQLLLLAIQARRPAPDARDRQEVSLARSVVTTLVTPPERAVRATGEWFRGLWFGYLDLVNVRKDNAALKEQIERLELEQASLAEDARQGQRLQKLLDFRQHYIYKTVPAVVIGTSGTDQSQVLYINKGSDDGLEQDMPVVTGDGIVGRVKDVFDHSAQVLLISDPTSGVGVILEKTRTRGVLKGTFNGPPQVINVSPDERIQPGDRILTSGGDQIFPRGLPVGTVDHLATDPDRDPLIDVTIHPAANLSRLEEVLVVTSVGPSMSPQSAKDLAASEAEGEAAQKRASDILSERLPSKVDQNAPADTNPDANQNANGATIRPIPPPRNLHPDQYTPGSVPAAGSLTPGARLAPLRRGTEDIPAPKPKPAVSAASGSEPGAAPGVGAGPAHAGVAGTAGNAVRPAGIPSAARSVTGAGTTGSTVRPASATSATGVPHTTAAPSAAHPVSGAAVTTEGAGARSTASTQTTHPASGSSGGAAGAVRTPSSAAGTPHPVVPHTVVPGSATSAPRAVPGTTPGTASTATHPATAAPGPASGTASGPASGTASGQAKPHVNVIVDGPARNSTVRPAAKPVAPPASGSQTNKPATSQAPATHAPQPPLHRGPTLVPDDGSRPPSARPRPRPQTPTQPQTQTTTPPGGN